VIEPYVKTRRLRRVEYDRLVDLGMFAGERLELPMDCSSSASPRAAACSDRSPST
jgi:hypothetical protein